MRTGFLKDGTDQNATPGKNVTLKPFDIYRDLPVITAWLKLPYVQRWWGDPGKNLDMITAHSQSMQAMIRADLISIGYICWQYPSEQELIDAGLTDLPQGLIDIMIGEPVVRKPSLQHASIFSAIIDS